MRYDQWCRIPTAAEIADFDGRHCARAYQQAIEDGWRCPCCGRNPYELIRWTYLSGKSAETHGDEYGMGWTITIVRHHCHYRHWARDRHGKHYVRPGRFDEVIMCGDCNTADGKIKKDLALPKYFSFAPSELRQFVTCTPHSGLAMVDYQKAQEVFAAIMHEMAPNPTPPMPPAHLLETPLRRPKMTGEEAARMMWRTVGVPLDYDPLNC